MRRVVFMAAVTAIRWNPPIRDLCLRQGPGRPAKVALVAAMRKLLTILQRDPPGRKAMAKRLTRNTVTQKSPSMSPSAFRPIVSAEPSEAGHGHDFAVQYHHDEAAAAGTSRTGTERPARRAGWGRRRRSTGVLAMHTGACRSPASRRRSSDRAGHRGVVHFVGAVHAAGDRLNLVLESGHSSGRAA